ncbi:MAG: PAS domain S-box protein [Gemmataceae bacterium]|nr:PAS domain S-box protein [Gemmataceae bacterium]
MLEPGQNDVSRSRHIPSQCWLLLGAGLVAFHLCLSFSGAPDGIWFPAVGVGIALIAWLGPLVVPFLVVDALLANFLVRGDAGFLRIVGDSLLAASEPAIAWWVFAELAGGRRRLDDPRSATVFLLLVPGVVSAAFAALHALFLPGPDYWLPAAGIWIARALGTLVLVPPLLVYLTPWLLRQRMVEPDPPSRFPGGKEPDDWTWGEIIETGGLSLAAGILGPVLLVFQVQLGMPGWALSGVSLLVVVWAALRQGLRGGALAASVNALLVLIPALFLNLSAAQFSPLQGNLLGQCSTVLLVGASAGWIRASEARYRQVVGHIPVVLYSVRFPRGLSVPLASVSAGGQERNPVPRSERTGGQERNPVPRSERRGEVASGPLIVQQAEVTLVSAASRNVFGCEPEELLGPFADWMERIDPRDREIVIGALGQLCLQKEPVSCEYRLYSGPMTAGRSFRWVRDTMVPFQPSQQMLDGWEGVIEDITDRRALAQDLRRNSSMLQALVTHLPAGVFFVQAPHGNPILVNQRARQLLGQREDLAAGIEHLTQVYRFHRTDGTPYPPDELPVAKALRQSMICMANDIVVHRTDGRKVPLIVWAAPVDFSGQGQVDAAVWVLEDLSSLQQAETARRESEARLRAVIETMAEGLIVQDRKGVILECNPAACAILGHTREELLGRPSLGPDEGCVREDRSPLPPDEHPDRLALATGAPVRNVLMGVPINSPLAPARKEGEGSQSLPSPSGRGVGEQALPSPSGRGVGEQALPSPSGRGVGGEGDIRWLFVNSMPIATTPTSNLRNAAVVTTFADMTAHRQTLDELHRAQRLELVGKLASGTIHDFNNLLSVVLGLAELIQTSLPQDSPVHEDMRRLMDAGEQASHLARQLLAFSKVARPKLMGVDINTIVVHSLKLLKSSFPADVCIEQRLGEDGLLAQAEETQLKQVVMNLCLNARDAMPHGGVLTVGTERLGPEVSPLPQGEGPGVRGPTNGPESPRWVRLSFQDSGHGIDDDALPRIFEPFFSTKERGSGLGLAVVKQIVEGFGGKIHVYSKVNEGTRMEVWLLEARS